jgi:catechol 2,3-dioxygenase-like lactoylglutathione lyase family enzyme
MIKGLHAMFYTEKAEQMRAFLRDVLDLPYTDVGDGWLIFDAPEADIGCHPSESQFHELSFYCDDIEQTVAALKKKGVEFTQGVEDHGYGLVTYFRLPDGSTIQLYQPQYRKG